MKKISNFKFQISNFKRGFTLIELIIYMAIFAIVLAIAVDLFFFSKTLANQIAQEQEVDRNARVAFLEMTQTIRSATSVTSPALGASNGNLYLNSNAIHYFVNGSGILQKTDGGQTRDLTSDEVSIQNLTFTNRGETGKQPSVVISFTVQTNSLIYGQAGYINKNFQTTVQLR